MTRWLDSLAARPPATRITLALLLGLAGLFLLGMAGGLTVTMVAKGMPSRPWVLALPVITAPLGGAALYTAWRLAASPATATPYERRYWRMWALIVVLGIPVGLLFGMTSKARGFEALNPFSSAPMAPAMAVLIAVVTAAVLIVAVVLYHRAIDDHEERAYLWASQIAYYFVFIAMPVWWLLERGGLLGPLTVGWALLILLASGFVHGVVWAWLKFR